MTSNEGRGMCVYAVVPAPSILCLKFRNITSFLIIAKNSHCTHQIATQVETYWCSGNISVSFLHPTKTMRQILTNLYATIGLPSAYPGFNVSLLPSQTPLSWQN